MVKLSDGDGQGKGRKRRSAAPTPDLPLTGTGTETPAAKKRRGKKPAEPMAADMAPPSDAAEPTPTKRRKGKKPLAPPLVEPAAEAPTVESPPAEPVASEAKPLDPSDYTQSGYTAKYGGTVRVELRRDKETGSLVEGDRTPIANFAARVVAETITDDGAEQARELQVEACLPGRPSVTAAVPVEEFAGMGWVIGKLGVDFIIQHGTGRKDQLRVAIQEMTDRRRSVTVAYSHVGWRERDGRHCYLHNGGAVGAPAGAVTVRLDKPLDLYRLPDPPTGAGLKAAVRASLALLSGLATDTLVFPLLATTYRAPLGPADYGVWAYGQSQLGKTAMAALFQQHYGAGMGGRNLPGSWSSTENTLEEQAFLLKDAVFVIDDFAPSESKHDADRQHRVLERMVRAQGNGSGRGRMTTRNGSRPKMTPARPPRGIIVSTAEDVPKLQSLIARLCVLEVRRGDVNLSRLSSHQRDADEGKYAAAMAGYLAFLAPQYGQVRAGLAAERDQLRDLFVGQLQHARTPTVTADLLLGLRYLLRFAEAVGAVTADQQAALWKRGSAACLAVARGQAEHQMAMDPVAQFPARLASILSSGKGHLAGPDGRTPANSIPPDVWGWAPHENGYQERGPKIGWVDADTIYLDQDAAFAALSSLYLSHGGKTLPFGQETFWKRLKGEGLLTRTEPQKTTYRWHLGGIRRAVAWVRIDTVFPADGSPKAGSVPVSDPSCPCDGGEQGQEKDANCHEKPGFVPAVPVVPAPGGRVPTSQTLLGDDSDGYDEIAR